MSAACRLEIQHADSVDVRTVHPAPGADRARVDGKCPSCGVEPFFVAGGGMHRHSRDTLRAGGRSMCCGEAVGWIYAKVDTLFGLEEDQAVLNGRARVYG